MIHACPLVFGVSITRGPRSLNFSGRRSVHSVGRLVDVAVRRDRLVLHLSSETPSRAQRRGNLAAHLASKPTDRRRDGDACPVVMAPDHLLPDDLGDRQGGATRPCAPHDLVPAGWEPDGCPEDLLSAINPSGAADRLSRAEVTPPSCEAAAPGGAPAHGLRGSEGATGMHQVLDGVPVVASSASGCSCRLRAHDPRRLGRRRDQGGASATRRRAPRPAGLGSCGSHAPARQPREAQHGPEPRHLRRS